jgi:integrase/recombinase XerD
LRNYEFILGSFQKHFGDIDLSVISSEDILGFMSTATDGTSQNTKKLRFTLISAFFNFVKNSLDSKITNPYDNPALRKLFRAGKFTQLKILEKDAVDEIIFRTSNQRNRLILELMARSGMGVGEVLKLKPMDIDDRKAIIRDPKSGKEAEVVFLPQKVADRLRTYIRSNRTWSARQPGIFFDVLIRQGFLQKLLQQAAALFVHRNERSGGWMRIRSGR